VFLGFFLIFYFLVSKRAVSAAQLIHSSLGYKPPDEFEKDVMKLKPAERPVQKIWGKVV